MSHVSVILFKNKIKSNPPKQYPQKNKQKKNQSNKNNKPNNTKQVLHRAVDVDRNVSTHFSSLIYFFLGFFSLFFSFFFLISSNNLLIFQCSYLEENPNIFHTMCSRQCSRCILMNMFFFLEFIILSAVPGNHFLPKRYKLTNFLTFWIPFCFPLIHDWSWKILLAISE